MGLDISFHKTKNNYIYKELNSKEFDFIYDNEKPIMEFRNVWDMLDVIQSHYKISDLCVVPLKDEDIKLFNRWDIYPEYWIISEIEEFIENLNKAIVKNNIIILISY